MVNELRAPTQWRYERIVIFSIVVALVLYFIVAIAGYATYGSDIEDNILINYPSEYCAKCAGNSLLYLVPQIIHITIARPLILPPTPPQLFLSCVFIQFRECSCQCCPGVGVSPGRLLIPIALPPRETIGSSAVEADGC
jgi:hypothetical protein